MTGTLQDIDTITRGAKRTEVLSPPAALCARLLDVQGSAGDESEYCPEP